MSFEKLNIVIPIQPISKKNSQQILINRATGRPFIMPSKKYIEYQKACAPYLPALRIDYPINLKCVFYMGTRRKCDLTNMLEAIDDVLVKYGVIEDDNFTIVTGHDGSRIEYSKEKPRTEIEITRFKMSES